MCAFFLPRSGWPCQPPKRHSLQTLDIPQADVVAFTQNLLHPLSLSDACWIERQSIRTLLLTWCPLLSICSIVVSVSSVQLPVRSSSHGAAYVQLKRVEPHTEETFLKWSAILSNRSFASLCRFMSSSCGCSEPRAFGCRGLFSPRFRGVLA